MLVLGKMIVTQYIKSYVAFQSTMIYQVENANIFKVNCFKQVNEVNLC